MVYLPIFYLAAVALTADTERAFSSPVQCVAGGGKYRLIKLIGSQTSLSAQVRVVRRDPGIKTVGEWSPAAGLLFILPRKYETAGVQVHVDSKEPETLRVLIRKPGLEGATSDFAAAPVGATVPLSAHVKSDILTVSAGTIQQTTKLNEKLIRGAALMCSSGSFEFSLEPGLQIDPTASEPSFDPWNSNSK